MLKISIITVSYNSEKTIKDTIESVLAQDYPLIEYIIIDGASSDQTVSLAKSYEDVFKIKNVDYRIISKADNGLYDAMNKGVRLSTGDVVGILNSDDFYLSSDVLSRVMHCISEADSDVLHAGVQLVSHDKTDEVVRTWHVRKGRFQYGWMPPHPSTFIKKSLYNEYGLYNTDYRIAADYDLLYRIHKIDTVRITYLDEIIISMRLGGTSTNGLSSYFKGNRETYRVLKEHRHKFKLMTIGMKIVRKIPQYF